MRRATLALALGSVIAGPAAGAFAATGSTQPAQTSTAAPSADSHATAVTLDDLLKVGDTSSHAGNDGGSATASALSVGGSTLADGKTGGSQTSPGSSSGAILDTGATPLGQLAVTPWSASAAHDASGSSSSSSDAALAHATLIDRKTLELYLFHSHSDSQWNADQSSSSSTSDGASLNAGDGALDVVLLHSQSQSGGKGSSTLLSINGNDIGSSDQANGTCVLAVPSVVTLTCLDASGGKGSSGGSSTADTATAALGGSTTPQGSLTAVGSRGAKAPTQVEGEKLTKNNNNGSQPNGASVEAARVPSGGGLPFTGFNAALISAYGAALAGLGGAILRVGRRRREHA